MVFVVASLLVAPLAFFLVQNLVITVFLLILYSIVPSPRDIVVAAAPYSSAINALESIALANLFRVTWA